MAGVRPGSEPDGGACGPAEDDLNIANVAFLKQWATYILKVPESSWNTATMRVAHAPELCRRPYTYGGSYLYVQLVLTRRLKGREEHCLDLQPQG